MIVVDTNVIAYLYLSNESSLQSEQLLKSDPEWVVPVLWRSEFRNILALYLRKQILKIEDALRIMGEAEALVSGAEYEVASTQVLSKVMVSECSAYDCEFVALADYLGVPLVTADRQILRSFPATALGANEYLARLA